MFQEATRQTFVQHTTDTFILPAGLCFAVKRYKNTISVLEYMLFSNFHEKKHSKFVEIVCFLQREKLGNRSKVADPYNYPPEGNRGLKGF